MKRFTREQIISIWNDLRPAHLVANDFGCSQSYVYDIRTGRRHSDKTGGANIKRNGAGGDHGIGQGWSGIWDNEDLRDAVIEKQKKAALWRWPKKSLQQNSPAAS